MSETRKYEKNYEEYRNWNVYFKGRLLGKTYAPSAEKAINNVRFSNNMLFEDWDDFEAKDAELDKLLRPFREWRREQESKKEKEKETMEVEAVREVEEYDYQMSLFDLGGGDD